MLGTYVEITVPGDPRCSEPGFAAIARVEKAMSFHSEDSDLARLRRAPCGTAVEVEADTVEVIRFAAELYEASAGLFDVTVGDELSRSGFLPRPRGKGLFRRWGSASDIEIVSANRIRCDRPLLIDLGGIAKGFAVDRAVEALQAAGLAQGMVNAGGDLRVFGGAPWTISLRDADGSVRSTVDLTDCAAASSSNLHNRRRRFGRVHTPHIGSNRRPLIASGRVTVVAPHCMLADALTKVAMADPSLAARILALHGGYLLQEGQDAAAELAA